MSVSIASGMVVPVPTGTDAFGIGAGQQGSSKGGGFSDVLKNSLNQVSDLQGSADQQVNALMQGGQADMSKVMISVEKADVAFQLMLQVRNKVVSAYQDIEKMQF